MDLTTLWVLKDKGIVTEREIQERLRQTKERLAALFGPTGDAAALMEQAMLLVAKGGDGSVVVPFGPKPTEPR